MKHTFRDFRDMVSMHNPFTSLLTSTGRIDRAAVLRRAWARFKADRFALYGSRNRHHAFARFLREAWATARLALANAARAAASIPAPIIPSQPVVLAPLTADQAAWIAYQCSTDGMLPTRPA